jgi:membrane protein DedA with SNARE-associated domain
MSLTELLAEYGYLAVFVASVLEGEALLVLAGFAAHQGYLSLPLVILLAFRGGTLGDQFFFLLGRRYGRTLIGRFPRWSPQVQRVSQMLCDHRSVVIIGVRFMYGLRIVGPIVIGASGIAPGRFAFLNLIGAAIWAVIVGGAGYLFGHALEWLFSDLRRYEEAVLLLFITVAVTFGLIRRLR